MTVKNLIIVLMDISGYTDFIKSHKSSQVHAEEIIFQLLETIVEGAKHPLQFNKLEGDAVLMYAEVEDDPGSVMESILAQVKTAFPEFKKRSRELESDRHSCPCDACQNIQLLQLKAIMHHGPVTLRKFKDQIEIAGEDVIIAHRLLKNSVPLREYILISDVSFNFIKNKIVENYTSTIENLAGIGEVKINYFEINI